MNTQDEFDKKRQRGATNTRSHSPLRDRLALSPKEAAQALGISERTLRDNLSEVPHAYIGRRVIIPTEGLKDWIDSKCEANSANLKSIADEILEAVAGNDCE